MDSKYLVSGMTMSLNKVNIALKEYVSNIYDTEHANSKYLQDICRILNDAALSRAKRKEVNTSLFESMYYVYSIEPELIDVIIENNKGFENTKSKIFDYQSMLDLSNIVNIIVLEKEHEIN
jgi:hypothetical protein